MPGNARLGMVIPMVLLLVSGRAAFLMDTDPGDLLGLPRELLVLWADGNEVVFGVQRSRKKILLKRPLYPTSYWTLRSVAYLPTSVDSAELSLIDEKVPRLIVKLPEQTRFLRGTRAGVRQQPFTQMP